MCITLNIPDIERHKIHNVIASCTFLNAFLFFCLKPTASQVTTPESFIEYKVRLFRTIPKISDDASEDLKLQDGSNKKKALEWQVHGVVELLRYLNSIA